MALPQYTKTVEKTRASEAFTNLRAIKTASEIYLMEHGVLPTNAELYDLNIDINDKDKFTYIFSNGATSDINHLTISASSVGGGYAIVWNSTTSITELKNRWHCQCATKSRKGKSVCLSLGGVYVGTSGTDRYLLPN